MLFGGRERCWPSGSFPSGRRSSDGRFYMHWTRGTAFLTVDRDSLTGRAQTLRQRQIRKTGLPIANVSSASSQRYRHHTGYEVWISILHSVRNRFRNLTEQPIEPCTNCSSSPPPVRGGRLCRLTAAVSSRQETPKRTLNHRRSLTQSWLSYTKWRGTVRLKQHYG